MPAREPAPWLPRPPAPRPSPAPATRLPPAAGPLDGAGLAACLLGIAALPRFATEREARTRALIGREVAFVLDVVQVSHTSQATPGFADGRTAAGKVHGTAAPVAVRAPPSHNAFLEDVPYGAGLLVRGVVVGWDALAGRGVVEAGEVVPAGD